ncbi:hypothetical protein CRH09_29945 [Nocardia terpenica]|uniref:Uncharacterized protein n=1 Tax=Nocardia terpenica TaxID=455432 RepID=A0A291RR94_9NOCA|nr:hypothetical protein CRH09_29945 [Nocardia terpenica]
MSPEPEPTVSVSAAPAVSGDFVVDRAAAVVDLDHRWITGDQRVVREVIGRRAEVGACRPERHDRPGGYRAENCR